MPRLAVALLVALMAVGAATAHPAPPTSAGPSRPLPSEWSAAGADYYPTDLGRSWIYEEPWSEIQWHEQITESVALGWQAPMLTDVVRLRKVRPFSRTARELGETVNGIALQETEHGVVGLGEGLETPGRESQQWDPPRLVMPAKLSAGTAWELGDERRRVVGLADVKIGETSFEDCLVLEAAPAARPEAPWDSRLYFARGVGLVLREVLKKDGDWMVRQVLVERTVAR